MSAAAAAGPVLGLLYTSLVLVLLVGFFKDSAS